MNCTDLCGCSDTGEGCENMLKDDDGDNDDEDDGDDHDDETEYEYIPDFDNDLDGEFDLRLLVDLDSVSNDKYPS